MHSDYEQFYKIGKSLRGFKAEQARFGAFPLPTDNTLLAAELLCRAFIENDVPRHLGAICIVELRTPSAITFVVTASGGANIPDNAIDQLQLSLQEAIGSTFCRVACVTFDTAAVFYSPSHIDTRNYVLNAFVPPKATPELADLNAAIDEIKRLPNGLFGRDVHGKPIGGSFDSAVLPIRRLLGCAVALRCDLFPKAQQTMARQSIKSFCQWASRQPYGDRCNLGVHVEALCIMGGNPNQYMYRDNPNVPVSTEAAIQKHVNSAWQCADSSRFCAEPKAFNLIEVRGLKGDLAGQLAMWWDARPNRFCTPNLEGGPYTQFMLPCTSCHARSAQMVAGLAVFASATVTRDEPMQTQASTATRLRRGSI
ncbi:hypothetical protein [Pseudomonas ovata]|uniref:hypothetical protein n=1 Tax=Pseudomonas ovata TaxID=1839709 RepID=UPI000D69268E|nr:hypothetical protein [Pseudomonas ovata]